MTNFSDSLGRKKTGGDFISDLTNAIRENPVPAALVGMGVLWLFSGGNKMSLFGRENSLLGAVRHGAGAAASAGYHGTEKVGSMIAGGVSSAAHLVGQGGSQAAGAARAAGDAVGETVGQAMNQAASSTSGFASSAREMASEAAGVGQTTGREWAGTIQNTLGDAFAKQPLLLGALGLGIGAAIAASAPATDAETRLVGDTAAAFKAQAQSMMSEKTQEAKALGERALAEAQSQGLTPRGAGQSLREVAKDMLGTVEKTVSGTAVPLSPG
jgi:hypothetical protein